MKKVKNNKNEKLSSTKNKLNMSTNKRHKTKSLHYYRLRLILTYTIIFLIISFLCLFVSSTVLFKIKTIEVQGDEVCSREELVKKSEIKTGDNLFFTKMDLAKEKLEKEIPEIEKVTIKKKIPNKVIIDVKKANKVFDIEHENQHIYTNATGKVLGISDEPDKNLIILRGVGIKSFDVGSKVIYNDASVSKKINELINQMKSKCLYNITEIDFNDGLDIMVNYEDRIKINFGIYENMDYKIRTAAEILNKKLGNTEKGTLDLSVVSAENRSYFTPSY